MKKFILSIVCLGLIACQKNNTIARVEPLQKTTENINVFNSIDELQKLVDSDVPTENFNIRKSYRVLALSPSTMATAKEAQNIANETEILLEKLIPDNNLRNLVNDKGEFIVADNIYRIAPEGTFYTNIRYKDEIDLIDSAMVAKASYISESLKKIGNVYLYETFGNQTEVETIDDVEAAPRKAKANINAFPVKNVARWTVVGKWIDNIFGHGKWHYEPIEDRRRIGANLYDHNYVVIKTAGFKAQIQDNFSWFKTWKNSSSWDRELTIGWQNMIFELSIPKVEHITLPKNVIYEDHRQYQYAYNSTLQLKDFPLSLGEGGVTVLIPILWVEKTFSYDDLLRLTYKFLGNVLVNQMRNLAAKGFIVEVPSQGKVYLFVADSKKTVRRVSLSHVYRRSFDFIIHAGNGGGFGYYLGKSLSDSRNMKDFRLISGEAYAYTTDEKGNYKGMVVRKYIK